MVRTWQELSDLAQATGTYAGYVGDGASIPWQTVGWVAPPLGFSMLAYKEWLDSRYPAAFKLHDWIYTPYGGLITATQVEADQALRQQILDIGGITSIVDANLVYAAVAAFGSYFFGTSGVGFDPALYNQALIDRSPIKVGPNMPSTGGKAGISMPVKVVMIFQQTTLPGYSIASLGLAGRAHIGGWSESIWYAGSDLTALWNQLTVGPSGGVNWGLLQVRADLMTDNATIVGVRLYSGGSGKGNFRAIAYRGLYPSSVAEIPQMAVLGYLGVTGSTRAKRLTIRGIPDEMAKGGEFTPTSDYATRLSNYGAALGGFASFTKDDNAGLAILTISAAGVVQLNGVPPTWGVGIGVQIRSALNASGIRVGGKFACTAVNTPSNQFTIAGWVEGACTGGNALVPVSSIKGIVGNSLTISRLVQRKVGRPFEQYRGRRSKRR